MLKQAVWNEIKSRAQATPSGDIQRLDDLIGRYQVCPKTDTITRLEITNQAIEISNSVRRQPDMSGCYTAATILMVSALDTRQRLQMDANAIELSQKEQKPFKALDKSHRHEALDPSHRRWGVPGCLPEDFKNFRSMWKEQLVAAANPGKIGELVVESFYDWLGQRGKMESNYLSKYYTPEQLSKKRLMPLAHGEHNQQNEPLFHRQRKDGRILPYNTGTGLRIFVMLDKERFYMCRPDKSKDGAGAKHHSGLADGQPIFGAGAMAFTNGKITRLTQQSGHYRPRIDQMLNVLEALQGLGVELDSIVLEAYTYFNDPSRETPDTNGTTNLPNLQCVPASYYLETGGEWAYKSECYKSNPNHNWCAPVEEILAFGRPAPPLPNVVPIRTNVASAGVGNGASQWQSGSLSHSANGAPRMNVLGTRPQLNGGGNGSAEHYNAGPASGGSLQPQSANPVPAHVWQPGSKAHLTGSGALAPSNGSQYANIPANVGPANGGSLQPQNPNPAPTHVWQPASKAHLPGIGASAPSSHSLYNTVIPAPSSHSPYNTIISAPSSHSPYNTIIPVELGDDGPEWS